MPSDTLNTVKMGPRHLRRTKLTGAITLMLCLMLPAIMLLLISIYNNMLFTEARLDLERETYFAADAALSKYDRQLYEDYGLLALSEAALTDMPKAFASTGTANFACADDLFTNKTLKKAIGRHMSVKALLSLVTDLMSRYMPLKALAAQNTAQVFAANGGISCPDLGGSASDAGDDNSWQDKFKKKFENELKKPYDDAISELFATTGNDEDPESSDNIPKTIAGIGDFLDKFLQASDNGFMQTVYRNEYVLNYFSTRVNEIKYQNGKKALLRPDGVKLRDLVKNSQGRRFDCEQEFIAVGGVPDKAGERVKTYLRWIRFGLRYLEKYLDPVKKAEYMGKGTALSLTFSVMSLGLAKIPPEAIAQIFLLIDAVKESGDDVRALLSGDSINLINTPFSGMIRFNYRDYLRIFLLLQNDNSIYERLGIVIKKNTGKNFLTKIQVSLQKKVNGKTLSCKMALSYYDKKDGK